MDQFVVVLHLFHLQQIIQILFMTANRINLTLICELIYLNKFENKLKSIFTHLALVNNLIILLEMIVLKPCHHCEIEYSVETDSLIILI